MEGADNILRWTLDYRGHSRDRGCEGVDGGGRLSLRRESRPREILRSKRYWPSRVSARKVGNDERVGEKRLKVDPMVAAWWRVGGGLRVLI